MRPSFRLPPHILASILAVLAACVIALLAWPLGILGMFGLAIAIAGVGAFGVARAAARHRRSGILPGWVILSTDSKTVNVVSADIRWGAAIMGLTVAVMAAAAAPGLYVKDAGELAAAIRGLGVPHPTGFAAFCLAGKAFDLLPLGGGAFRMNLLSVVAIGVSAAMGFMLSMELARFAAGGRDSFAARLGALAAAIGLPASHLAWLHGTTTEVYAFSLAGTVAAIGCWTLGVTRRDARWLAVGALLTGLGLGGHLTWPLYSGLVGVVATVAFLRGTNRWRVLPVLAGAMVGGSLVVLYLPAVALRGPYMNWGDPSDAASMLAHLTGARIRASFSDQISQTPWPVVLMNLGRSLRTLSDGSLALIPVAASGALLLLVLRPAVGMTALGLVLADVMFSARVNPMGIVDLQTLLPATLFIAVLAGTGAAIVARRSARLAVPVAVVAIGLAIWQGAMSPADRDMTRVYGPAAITGDFLTGLAPGSVVFVSSDNLASGLAGMQVVEAARPDVLVLVKQHLADSDYVRERLAFHGGVPGEEGLIAAVRQRPFQSDGESPEAAVARAVQLGAQRGPVWFELGEGQVDRGLYPNLMPGFPAFSVGPAASPNAGRVLAARDSAVAVLGAADRWTAQWIGGFLRTTGAWVAARGDDGMALALTAQSLLVFPDDARAHFNLGILLRAAGDDAGALRRFSQAVGVDPGYVRAWWALAQSADELGLEKDAATARAQAHALSGGTP